jgi:hypothetical protein
MSIQVTINNTVIEIPSSAQSPNWAPGLIEFCQAVEQALLNSTSPGDIAPQIVNIDAQNPGTNIDVTGLNFSTSTVRSAIIEYSVSRSTSSSNATESGDIEVNYDASRGIGLKWAISRSRVGDAGISFSITDTGQLQFTTSALPGINHVGNIGFRARAILQS